ncbi:hypothetical protein RV01_GL002070 [Enterococcus dispar]|nr:hypothetical protein RV01_GL002070 [Enterococcus dispar]
MLRLMDDELFFFIFFWILEFFDKNLKLEKRRFIVKLKL